MVTNKSENAVCLEDSNPSSRILMGTPLPDYRMKADLLLRYPVGSKPLPTLEDYNNMPLKKTGLSRSRFKELYSADPDDMDVVKKFAYKNDLTVEDVDPLLRLMTVSGSIRDLNSAFGVNINYYKDDQYILLGHDGIVGIPPDLEGIVEFVLNLDLRPVGSIASESMLSGNCCERNEQKKYDKGKWMGRFLKGKSEAANNEKNTPEFYPWEISKQYNFPPCRTDCENRQAIAVLEFLGGFEMDIINRYFRDYSTVSTPPIKCIEVAGGRNNPGHLSDPYSVDDLIDYEVYLDIEVAASIANQADINVYFGPSWVAGYEDYYSFWRTLAAAVHDSERNNTVISCSWGWPEDLVPEKGKKLINQILMEAAALNITVCMASGDDGTRCLQTDGKKHVFFPASSPYALACGGTQFSTQDGTVQNEIVWNENTINQVTGGGFSNFFPMPPYQESITGSEEDKRGVPDVAGLATMSYKILTHHDMEPVPRGGGTSASAPLWAALFAIINGELGSE
jgi:kumamolisin